VVVEHGDLRGVSEVKTSIMLPAEVCGSPGAQINKLIQLAAEDPDRVAVLAREKSNN
jgi:hypothetical protein